MTDQEVIEIKSKALGEIAAAKDSGEIEALRIRYMGRNGLLPELMKELKNTPPDEKPAMGRELNSFREEISAALEAAKASLGKY